MGALRDAMTHLNESGQGRRPFMRPGLWCCVFGNMFGSSAVEREHTCLVGRRLGRFGQGRLLVSTRLKVPHVGWDQLDLTPLGRGPLFEGVAESVGNVYFTHSFALADDVPISEITAMHYNEGSAPLCGMVPKYLVCSSILRARHGCTLPPILLHAAGAGGLCHLLVAIKRLLLFQLRPRQVRARPVCMDVYSNVADL